MNTSILAHAVGNALTAKGLLSTDVPSVTVQHESAGLVARFHVRHHEARGRLVVRIAIDRLTAAGYTTESMAAAIVDTAVEMIGLTMSAAA